MHVSVVAMTHRDHFQFSEAKTMTVTKNVRWRPRYHHCCIRPVRSYNFVKEVLESCLLRCDRWLLNCRCGRSWGYLEGSITDVVDVSRCEVGHEE